MKKFLGILVLGLLWCHTALADDIRDFQIEGMSIGDSALDYFSEEEIKENIKNYYNDDKYIPVYIKNHNSFETYYGVQFHYKKNDTTFKIYAISGAIMFINNIKECYEKQKDISEELKILFPDTKINKDEGNHAQDKTGKSKFKGIEFQLKLGNKVSVDCYDWTEEMGYPDHLRVSIVTKEFIDWIETVAY